MGRREMIQGLAFLGGLVAIASEPVWAWLGRKDISPTIAQAGAALVGVAVLVGLLPHARSGKKISEA